MGLEAKIKAVATLSRKRRRERSLGEKPWYFSTGKHSRGSNGMEGKEGVRVGRRWGRGESRKEWGAGRDSTGAGDGHSRSGMKAALVTPPHRLAPRPPAPSTSCFHFRSTCSVT